ncbi:MAG: diaminopimelate epimerase [Candidatus Dormibacteraeota bacterium]|nr:diaminopimelate epimerase [Candidatus Dormibacteraeota bacterium]
MTSAPPARLHLVKYQALGNDYLVLDLPAPLDAVVQLLPQLCDRHRGVGSDGLLAFDPATFALRIFNPDSSEAEKSGSGLRVAACHAVLEHGATGRLAIATRDRVNDVLVLRRRGPEVVSRLDIGAPRFEPDSCLELETPAGRVSCRLVDVGNPHCVVFEQPVTPERCRRLGPLLENHPRFPDRTNVQLVEPLGRDRARVEIWERGAGYTLASGTSASAVAAALIHSGRSEPSLDVLMPGGTLHVEQLPDGHLVQTGPAQRVCEISLWLDDLVGPLPEMA